MSYSTLVTCATLAEHVDDAGWVICDCRHQLVDATYGERAYAEGHLPGAHFLHVDRDLSAPMNGHNGRHPLPDPEVLAARLTRLGISRQVQVVVYDDADGMFAGRLWWLLRWIGHERVAVLDGGIRRWLKEERPLSRQLPSLPAQPSSLPVALRPWVVSADEVLGNLRAPRFCVVDARAPDRFRGENETIDPVGGHIPGARNRFFRDNLDGDGLFLAAEQLRREYLTLLDGYAPGDVVMQCGSGVTACHNLLAMEVAGLPGARLYAGSWSEWCSDPARPVER